MLVAINDAQGRFNARSATKADAPFRCPSCEGLVVLKKGTKVVHHFAHKPDADCRYGEGESKAHMEAKYGIHDLLKSNPKVSRVELEWKLEDGCIADVYAEIGGERIAIELQHSQQTEVETIRRTGRYRELGVAVMWVAVPKVNKLTGNGHEYNSGDGVIVDEYRPTAMEKFFKGLHLGTYFLWRSDTKTLHKATLSDVERYVDGNEYGGGYTTTYKDRKDLHLSQPLRPERLGLRVQQCKQWRSYPNRRVIVSVKEEANA
jgi:hypothetical protein